MAARNLDEAIAPPSLEVLDNLLLLSRAHLAEGWANPDALGDESDIFLKCREHFDAIMELPIPLGTELKDVFAEALQVAWFACWRARDYTVKGWGRRAEKAGTLTGGEMRAIHELRSNSVQHLGEYWPKGHVPLFDKSGRLASNGGPPRHVFNAYPRNSILQEGWMFGAGHSIEELFGERRPVSWSYFSPSSKLGSAALDCCWVDSDDHLTGVSFSDTVVRNISEKRSELVSNTSWKNVVFLKNATFNLEDDLPDSFIEQVKVANVLTLRLGTTKPHELVFDAPKGIRTIEIHKAASSAPTNVAVFDANLSLTFKGQFSLGVPSSCSIFRSNILLQYNNVGGMDVVAEDCSLDFQLKNSSIGEAKFKKCDLEEQIWRPAELPSTQFLSSSVGKLLIERCSVQLVLSQSKSSFESIQFEASTFENVVSFSNAKISNSIRFIPRDEKKCIFESIVDLSCSGVKGEQLDIPYTELVECSFKDRVNLSNREFSGTTSFLGSIFHSHLIVHGASLHQDTDFGNTTFLWRNLLSNAADATAVRRQLGSLSNSYRSLRQAMEKNNASHDVQMFHLLQMRTRNHLKHGTAAMSERLLGNAYDIISEYGSSFVRPAFGLVGTLLATFVLYLVFTPAWGNLSHVFSAAFTSTFRPYVTFSAVYGSWNASTFHFDSGHEVLAYLVQKYGATFAILSFLQSTFVVLLIFLMLLAIRRKYQLN